MEGKLRSVQVPEIEERFAKLCDPPADEVNAFVTSRPIKQRAIDPDILLEGGILPLSEFEDTRYQQST